MPMFCFPVSLWRNRLARSTVNRKVGGSSPPRDDTTFVYSFSYMVCPCGNKPVAEATDHNQDAGSNTSQNKRDKNNNRGNKKGSKKEKKTKANQFNTMKHIFGNANVYDYNSGGKHSLP